MGLNYSLLELHELKQIILVIEERWLRRRQDASFKFVLPQLIHTVKWKYNCILFKQVKKKINSSIVVECKNLFGCAHVPRLSWL